MMFRRSTSRERAALDAHETRCGARAPRALDARLGFVSWVVWVVCALANGGCAPAADGDGLGAGGGGAQGSAGAGPGGGASAPPVLDVLGGARPGSGGGGAGGGGPCPADMVLAGASCIDRYEAPNVAGVAPLAMQTAYDGEAWCAAHDKRLCRDVEWIRACEGATGTLYPYGESHVAHRCDDDKTWIPPDWGVLASWPSQAAQDEAAALYQADPSGARTACVSADGAFDLTGNVAEWVVRTIPNANDYDHVMKGCYWSGCYGGTLPNCTFVNPAHPGGFRSYEAGFRCCRDAGPIYGD